MPSGVARMTGANKPGPRGEREAAEKTVAQGMPVDRLDLWYLPPAFFFAGGPWGRPSPRIPCALRLSRGRCSLMARTPSAPREDRSMFGPDVLDDCEPRE